MIAKILNAVTFAGFAMFAFGAATAVASIEVWSLKFYAPESAEAWAESTCRLLGAVGAAAMPSGLSVYGSAAALADMEPK